MDPDKRRTVKRLASLPVGYWLTTVSASAEAQGSENVREVAEEHRENAADALWELFKDLRSENGRRRFVKESADSVDGLIPSVLANQDKVGPENAGDFVGPTLEVIEKINEELELSLPQEYLEGASKASQALPVVNSLLEFLDACQTISQNYDNEETFVREMEEREEKTDEDEIPEPVERFYVSLLLIAVELALIPSSVGFRSAWVGTRYAANYGLVRIRGIVGLEVYAVLLSGVHWSIRGTIEGAISYIVTKSSDIADEVELEMKEVPKEQLKEYDFLEDDVDDDSGSWFGLGNDEDEDSFTEDFKADLKDDRGLIDGDGEKEDDGSAWSQFKSWFGDDN